VADEPIDVYANSAQFSIGVYDFMIDFGVQDPVTNPSQPPGVRSLVRVRMSPQHAFVLARALSDAVRKYEQQIGKVNLPPQVFINMGIEP